MTTVEVRCGDHRAMLSFTEDDIAGGPEVFAKRAAAAAGLIYNRLFPDYHEALLAHGRELLAEVEASRVR